MHARCQSGCTANSSISKLYSSNVPEDLKDRCASRQGVSLPAWFVSLLRGHVWLAMLTLSEMHYCTHVCNTVRQIMETTMVEYPSIWQHTCPPPPFLRVQHMCNTKNSVRRKWRSRALYALYAQMRAVSPCSERCTNVGRASAREGIPVRYDGDITKRVPPGGDIDMMSTPLSSGTCFVTNMTST